MRGDHANALVGHQVPVVDLHLRCSERHHEAVAATHVGDVSRSRDTAFGNTATDRPDGQLAIYAVGARSEPGSIEMRRRLVVVPEVVLFECQLGAKTLEASFKTGLGIGIQCDNVGAGAGGIRWNSHLDYHVLEEYFTEVVVLLVLTSRVPANDLNEIGGDDLTKDPFCSLTQMHQINAYLVRVDETIGRPANGRSEWCNGERFLIACCTLTAENLLGVLRECNIVCYDHII